VAVRLPAEAVRLPAEAVRLPEYFRGRKIALRGSDIACILAVTLPEVAVTCEITCGGHEIA
jgi:hypothetical protein